MLSINANKAATGHRRQNSTPIASNSAMYAAFATTNPQQSLHRRGLSTGYSAHSQDQRPVTPDGKVSINSNGHQGQPDMRAAQMPASSRPGHTNQLNVKTDSHEHLHQTNQNLVNISEESEEAKSHFGSSRSMAVSEEHNGVASSQPNGAAAMLLDLVQKLHSFSNADVKEALEAVGAKIPGSYVDTRGASGSPSIPMRRGHSWQEPALASRNNEHARDIPKAPHTVPLRCSATFDVAAYPSTTFPDFGDLKGDLSAPVGGYSSSNYSPMTNRSGLSSFQSSPELAPINLFDSHGAAIPEFGIRTGDDLSPFSPGRNGHKRNDSAIYRGDGQLHCSEDETVFKPEDYLVPSNVTDEEINAFIQGPDEAGKYRCLYDGCKNSPFGRKENIRAHVQTHLDDRRYQCDSCRHKFVRPNDLKRHWQIHVNKRDFKCFCGAAFNRHDALKRHRERSEWCESDGTRGSPDSPKKDEKKRGRPKKIAPTESQERRERKALIRREVRKKQEAASAASSVVSMESPPPDFDFGEYAGQISGAQIVSPSHTSLTPPASPRDDMDVIFNSNVNTQRNDHGMPSLSPPPTRDSMLSFGLNGNSEGLMFADLEPTLPGANETSREDSSPHASPPGLDMGSSSPRPLFDFDLNSDQVILSQNDSDFTSISRTNESKGNELFSDFMFWADPKSADTFMGMNPNRLDVTLPHNNNSDPLFW